MVDSGYSVLYVGTATWLGTQSQYGCTETNAGAGPDAGAVGDAGATYVDGAYDFTRMPPHHDVSSGVLDADRTT